VWFASLLGFAGYQSRFLRGEATALNKVALECVRQTGLENQTRILAAAP
jgi:hypothetical protein